MKSDRRRARARPRARARARRRTRELLRSYPRSLVAVATVEALQHRQVVFRVGVVGLEAHGCSELGLGLLQTAQTQQDHSPEVVVVRLLGIEVDGHLRLVERA